MESFARRGVRTTVAVAGLAALGVGLAAPAFALPGVPDVSGIGNTQPGADHFGSQTGHSSALSTLPDAFAFQPPAADQTAPAAQSDAAQSDAAQPAEDTQSDSTQAEPQSEPTSSDSTAADSTDATQSDAAPAEQAPAPNPGLLPQIPGSPVAAQTTPNVSGINPGSALQGLDSGNLF